MPSLIDLRRRVRAVKNTQQITKAMKMVSAAKLRRDHVAASHSPTQQIEHADSAAKALIAEHATKTDALKRSLHTVVTHSGGARLLTSRSSDRLEPVGKRRKEFGETEGPQGRASGRERVN